MCDMHGSLLYEKSCGLNMHAVYNRKIVPLIALEKDAICEGRNSERMTWYLTG